MRAAKHFSSAIAAAASTSMDQVALAVSRQTVSKHFEVELRVVAFCAFDRNWIDAIDPQRDGFFFGHPETLEAGGSSC